MEKCLAGGLLLGCIVHSNDLPLVCITLRERVSARLLEPLDFADLVDGLSEAVHTWPVIR